MSIDLTKVMDYLKGYFNPSPVNYNVSEPNYDEMGSQYAVYARLMKESCKTDMGGDTINLSNVNSTVNDKGEEVITFQDGTIHTTKKDGSIVVEKSDGLIIENNVDGSSKYTYPDGTLIEIDAGGTKVIHYTDGLKMRESGNPVKYEIYGTNGWIDYNLGTIFNQVREVGEYNSESLKYLFQVYRYFHNKELQKYNIEDFHSYLMEYIIGTIINDENGENNNVINEEQLYPQIFNALDEIKEYEPSVVILGTKYWNYIIAILRAKNTLCPKYPLTLRQLERQFNEKKYNTTFDNLNYDNLERCSTKKNGYRCLKRQYMYLLDIGDLKLITKVVDEYKDEPHWLNKIKEVKDSVGVGRSFLHGGEFLGKGNTINYGNFVLSVSGKSLEFLVDRTNTEKPLFENSYTYPRAYYDPKSTDSSWICNLDDTDEFLFGRKWWQKYVYFNESCDPSIETANEFLYDRDKIKSLKLYALRNIVNMQSDVIWGNFFTTFRNKYKDAALRLSGTSVWTQLKEMYDGMDSIDTDSFANPYPWISNFNYNPDFEKEIMTDLSEQTFFDFMYNNVGSVCEKELYKHLQHLRENIPDDGGVGGIDEPNWDNILPSHYKSLKFIFEWFWDIKYGTFQVSDEETKKLELERFYTRMTMNVNVEDRDFSQDYIRLYSITHSKIKDKIDKIELVENGDLYFHEGPNKYLVVSGPKSNIGELYGCRLEIDNVIGPKIVDANNNILWGMLTHKTEDNDSFPLESSDYFQIMIMQMYFFNLTGISGNQLTNVIEDLTPPSVSSGSKSILMKYDSILETFSNGDTVSDELQYGNFVFRLYGDRMTFEGYSAYTAENIVIWEYKFGWDTNDNYSLNLYQNTAEVQGYTITDGNIHIMQKNDATGAVMNDFDFAETFKFTKFPGAKLVFNNTGPSIRYANMVIWHPLFTLSSNNGAVLEYMNKYANIGYLMSDIPDAAGYTDIEAFTNNGNNNGNNNQRSKQKHKNNRKSSYQCLYGNHKVKSPPILHSCINQSYLNTENIPDSQSNYSMFYTSNNKNSKYKNAIDKGNKMIKEAFTGNGNGTTSSGVCVGTDGLSLTNDNCKKNYPDVSKKDACNTDLWCKWSDANNNVNNVANNVNNIANNAANNSRAPASAANNFRPIEIETTYKNAEFENATSTLLSGDPDIDNAIGEGIKCLWHYDKETGKPGGRLSGVMNDKEWQDRNSELYAKLKNFVCPVDIPVCSGQKIGGLEVGKCIDTRAQCNHHMDVLLDQELKVSYEDNIEEEKKNKFPLYQLREKNIKNKQSVQTASSVINMILHPGDNPMASTPMPIMETFENNTNNGNNTNNDGNTCKYRIENKCYDQYIQSDKLYYDEGAKVFHSVFPKADENVFVSACYQSTKWFSDNLTKMLVIKAITGFLAFVLYWSINQKLDIPIRLFKAFMAFIFSEIYLLYKTWDLIIKKNPPLPVVSE